MNNVWMIASLWMAAALVASLISIRIGISVALVEIFLGVLGGNFLHMQTTPWIDFLASFGSILLTFLASAEIDPVSFRKHLKPSLAIGAISFALPFLGAFGFTLFMMHWTLRAAEIGGIALSTTSVAVVYAVMVETGLNRTELGKLILAACFVTDFGTVLALGVLFASFNIWLLAFTIATIAVLWKLPLLTRWVIATWGGRVSEVEVKFLFLVLFFLGGLATIANSEAVLPAYLIGLVVAGVFMHDRVLVTRTRTIAFALLTPFFFIKAGTGLLGPPTKFTTLSELSFTTRPSVRLMRNRPVEQMEGIYDLKQQLEEHLRSALRHLSCVSSFKARLARARGWPAPCRGSTARSGSATSGPISRALCSHRYPPSVC